MGAGILVLDDDLLVVQHLADSAEPAYRDNVRLNDLVRLPDGRPGMVTLVEFLPRSKGALAVPLGSGVDLRYSKVVSVVPSKRKTRLFGLLKEHPNRFADEEIEQLRFIASQDEYEALGAEAL